MAETRLYNSFLAEAWANAGRFVICGRRLAPFSLAHSLQLTQLDSPLWGGSGEAGPEDLDIATQICAQDSPLVEFAPVNPDFDPVAESEKWIAYIRTCAGRPMLKERTQAALGNPNTVPVEILAATYLLRYTNLT